MSSTIINVPEYGSKGWANIVLKLAIEELKNTDRVLSARQLEIFYFLGELERFGWRWQSARLRNHINLAIKQGRFSSSSFTASAEADPIDHAGGDSST